MRNVVFGIAIFSVLLALRTAQAKYSGGAGTPEAPYRIADHNDLYALADDTNDYNKCFVMTADIDLDPCLPGRRSLTTALIAPDHYPFDYVYDGNGFLGTFDGQGHTVSNLICDDNDAHYIGLFGYTATGSEIRNLNLANAQLEGYMYVGAVAGENAGSIANCHSEVYVQSYYGYAGGIAGENDGSILLSSSSSTVNGCVDLGGIVGWNYGIIEKCNSEGLVRINIANGSAIGGLVGINDNQCVISDSFSTSTVQGSNVNDSAGGLVGINEGVIERCYASGDVSATWRLAGGLIGLNNYGDVSRSYATGNVHGEEEVGGLVGSINNCVLTDCYSTGDVNGIIYVGGLSGTLYRGEVNNSYAIGNVIGVEDTGGLFGANNREVIVASFWDVNTSGQATSAGEPNAVGLTTSEMQMENSFTDAGWDFNDVWAICEGTNYPKLLWSIPAADFVCPDGVNFVDYSYLAPQWLASDCNEANGYCSGRDLDESGIIDEEDLKILYGHWLDGI